MSSPGVIALVDGEHHPPAVREALDALGRPVAAVLYLGGGEKVGAEVLADPEAHYGRPLAEAGPDAAAALRRLAAAHRVEAVVDLADEPVLGAAARFRLAAHALDLGLAYDAPGLRLTPPRYAPVPFDGPTLAVIGTGKRTGKTAVAGHWAALLRDRGAAPVIVAMGRGGPAEPRVAPANTALEDLEAVAAAGEHAASDYLEDAVLARVPAVGCRRVGGGPAGEPGRSTVLAGARAAAALNPRSILFEGSGGAIPPVRVARTVCCVGDRAGALDALGTYRLLRADLALVMGGDAAVADEVAAAGARRVLRCDLRPEPAEPVPAGARVALFTTGAGAPEGVEPLVASRALARRAELAGDLSRAAAERCDLYLTELKAAAIDTVVPAARRAGARVGFVRNRPVGAGGADLDAALVELFERA